MKAVILAGGIGSRISEETITKPKPLIEIGGIPLLWHIMKIYSMHNIDDFIICCGYKGYMIKEFFANYSLHMSDVTINLKDGKIKTHQKFVEPWNITLIDTGLETMTGGRLKRVKDHIGNETFCFTYGDGLSDINITNSIEFHKKQNTLATMAAVQPPGRFGKLNLKGEKISSFKEKIPGDGGWANGGFFVLEPGVFDYIENDFTVWEKEPLEKLAVDNQLSAFKHDGFWHPIDTLRDKNYIEDLWRTGNARWKTWK